MGLLILKPRVHATFIDAPGTAYLEEDQDVVYDAFSKHAAHNPGIGKGRLCVLLVSLRRALTFGATSTS